MAEIITENLTHVFSPDTPFEKAAIRDVSLCIPQGQFAALIGHTGSGKSTFIQHLNALLQPDMPDNTITYACWNMYSESNERILREKGIENVFRDSIDNDNLYLVAKPNANYPKLYGIYLSNHYAEKGKLVRLEQVDRIIIVGEYLGGIKQGDSLAVYKVTQYSK